MCLRTRYRMGSRRISVLLLLSSFNLVTCWSSPHLVAGVSMTRRFNSIDDCKNSLPIASSKRLLIFWKGESLENYSLGLRSLEFMGALHAILHDNDRLLSVDGDLPIRFTNALKAHYADTKYIAKRQIDGFNGALQYIDFDESTIRSDYIVQAAKRCSLINSIYEVGAFGKSYGDIIANAAAGSNKNGCFEDMKKGKENEHLSWRFRLRYFDLHRFGDRTTCSARRERDALAAIGPPLLAQFNGPVKLKKPDISLVLFEGLGLDGNEMALTRKLSEGANASIMKPTTRICITNTPLCPIAAFSLVNIGRVGKNQAVLDPYCGSAATLLAAALIEPTARTVGIEISHDSLVCRKDIEEDFTSRGAPVPLALIEGDATDATVRNAAQKAIGGDAFDVIVADPPYGIRESLKSNPLHDIFNMISRDRDAGSRLLKKKGRVVVFVPCCGDEQIDNVLPGAKEEREAGLRMSVKQKQQLNDSLDRWLVAYECVS